MVVMMVRMMMTMTTVMMREGKRVVTVYSPGVSWWGYYRYREVSTSFGVTHSSRPGWTS